MSDVTICNRALAKIGDKFKITNLTDQTIQAETCNLVYDAARKQTLEALDWGFARHRVALADLGSPPPGWAYRYAYPANCVKFRYIEVPDGTDPALFKIVAKDSNLDAKVILANVGPDTTGSAYGWFTANVTVTSMYPPSFEECLSWAVAGLVAYPLTRKKSIRDDMLTGWREALARAESFDAVEEEEGDMWGDAPWLKVRG